VILLPQSLKHWDYRCVPSYPAQQDFNCSGHSKHGEAPVLRYLATSLVSLQRLSSTRQIQSGSRGTTFPNILPSQVYLCFLMSLSSLQSHHSCYPFLILLITWQSFSLTEGCQWTSTAKPPCGYLLVLPWWAFPNLPGFQAFPPFKNFVSKGPVYRLVMLFPGAFQSVVT
jgi:hypothetical protein